MLLCNRQSPLLLRSFLFSAIFVLVTRAAKNYTMTGFCKDNTDGVHRNPVDCNKYFLCYKGGSQIKQCPAGLTFNEDAHQCDKTKCSEVDPFLDRALGFEDPAFCDGKSDGFYANPLDCTTFYRCHNAFTYAFRCVPTLVFRTSIPACDWPRRTDYHPTTCSTPFSSTPGPTYNPGTTRPTYNPWTPRPTFNPWTPRPTYNPWTPRPTYNPWTPRPTYNPWTPRPTFLPWTRPITAIPWTTPRATFNPWTTPRATFNPWTPRPVVTTRGPYVPSTYRPVTNTGFGGCNKVVCYFVNWAQYRSGNGKQFPNDVDPRLCTHVIFAFAQLSGNRIVPFEWNDETENYQKVVQLKQTNPALKVSLAVGGWNMGSTSFSRMVSTPQNRQEFISTTIAFLRQRGFDGIDVDWEYPANRGSPAGDKEIHATLLTEIRSAFDQEAVQTGNQRLLLTAAVSAGKSTIDSAYNVPVLNRMLDFINLMAYDLHGSWETKTGHNSPLFQGQNEVGDDRYLNVDWATKYWLQKGASPSKLILGLPLYGRSFRLSNPMGNTGVGAPTSGKGRAGLYTGEAGFLAYYEICQKISNGARANRLRDQMVPYLISGSDWIGYDDPESLVEKVKYAKRMNLGGVMVWDLSMDDFRGAFCNQGPWPLMNAIINQCRAP